MSPSDQPPPEPLVAAVPPRPGPHPTPVTRPYWEATTRHELLVQRCGSCDRRFHYPRSHCPTCWSSQLAWETASGGGVLVSATTIHRPGHPAFAAVAPYVVGLVDLDEGARLLANVDRPPTRELVVGERLALRWEDHGSYSLPWFHPVADPPDPGHRPTDTGHRPTDPHPGGARMTSATTPVLLDGARTAFGRLGGALAGIPGTELTGSVIAALVRRQPAYAHGDGVILGQVLQGGQGQNPARQAASTGGVGLDVPAVTVNNVCLAGLAALADASRRVRLGEGSLYLVGGGDSMTEAPHAAHLRRGQRLGEVAFVDTMVRDGLWCALGDEGMGELSERVNAELGVDRAAQDALAARSHRLAARATSSGRLATEIVTITARDGRVVDADEGIRPDTTPEVLAGLRPAFSSSGTITAGNASQMSDGASVGVVTSRQRADELGQQPLATIRAVAEVAGPDTSLHLRPAAAIRAVLDRTGLTLDDVEVVEINEAFAGVVAASCAELDLPIDRVNVNGGAIAVGHPLGGTGFRLALTAARELQERGARFAIASLCGGGGQGAAVLLEREG